MAGDRHVECPLHAEEILRSHRELMEKMDAIEKRLFRDNGTLSIQTRIERHEQILKVLL